MKNRKALRREVFEKYQPTIVFHAAAYKHVPLMETHPLESVRNNVVATKIVSERLGVPWTSTTGGPAPIAR